MKGFVEFEIWGKYISINFTPFDLSIILFLFVFLSKSNLFYKTASFIPIPIYEPFQCMGIQNSNQKLTSISLTILKYNVFDFDNYAGLMFNI